jgi:REP element-mobilizing transposase RayT
MPQSLAKIYLHLVFCTKNREPAIADAVRDNLHAYMATVLANIGCHANLINSVEDHIHILFELARTVTVSQVVEDVKKSSSKWMKTQPGVSGTFAWQSGYGVFSVSQSSVDVVRAYIANQREHHRNQSFQDELRALFTKHQIAFDERYVWD